MPLQTVAQTTFTLRTDVPPAFRPSHRSGILHARQAKRRGGGGGGGDEHAFAWIDDAHHVNVVEAITAHLVRFGFDGKKMYFVPYTNKANWMRRYPHAVPGMETEGGAIRSVPTAWHRQGSGSGERESSAMPLEDGMAAYDRIDDRQLEEQAAFLEARLERVRERLQSAKAKRKAAAAIDGDDDSKSENDTAPPPAKKRRYCSVKGCGNQVIKDGVCVRHGAKRECKHPGCTKHAKKGGVCVQHGAQIPRCSHPGCQNVRVKKRASDGAGVCYRHGAEKIKKYCKVEGCTNIIVKKGVCVRHGAESVTASYEGGVCVQSRKRCQYEDCSNIAKISGMWCYKHGLEPKYCNYDGCTNKPMNKQSEGGFCYEHGAKRKICSHEDCSSYVKKKGMCLKHYKELNLQGVVGPVSDAVLAMQRRTPC